MLLYSLSNDKSGNWFCVINVTSTSTSIGDIYGLFSDSTTTNPRTLLSQNVMQRTTVNVISSSLGTIRGIYITNTCQFAISDSYISASGTSGNIIGVESTISGSYVVLKTSIISGQTNDIKLQDVMSLLQGWYAYSLWTCERNESMVFG